MTQFVRKIYWNSQLQMIKWAKEGSPTTFTLRTLKPGESKNPRERINLLTHHPLQSSPQDSHPSFSISWSIFLRGWKSRWSCHGVRNTAHLCRYSRTRREHTEHSCATWNVPPPCPHNPSTEQQVSCEDISCDVQHLSGSPLHLS